MSYSQFVKMNYDEVKHLPANKRFAALGAMWRGGEKPSKGKMARRPKPIILEAESELDPIEKPANKRGHKTTTKRELAQMEKIKEKQKGSLLEMNVAKRGRPPKQKLADSVFPVGKSGKTMRGGDLVSDIKDYTGVDFHALGFGLMGKSKGKKTKGGDLWGDHSLYTLTAEDQRQLARKQPVFGEGLMKRKGKKTIRGGDLDLESDRLKALTAQIQLKQNEYSARIALDGMYPKPSVSPIPRGYPFFLFQHPNQYSANPNQVMVFAYESKFLRSPLYAKYKDSIVLKSPKYSGYGGDTKQSDAGGEVVPGKPFRVIFVDKSNENPTKYVLDCNDVDTFCDVMDMAKDTQFIVPVEILAKANIAAWKAEQQKLMELEQEYFQKGFDKATAIEKAKEEVLENHISQLEESASSGGGGSDDILSGIGSFFGSALHAFF
jgi:hypothetical protein